MNSIRGYHATNKSVAENIVINNADFKNSIGIASTFQNIVKDNQKYHWLGNGIYFWDEISNAKSWALYQVPSSNKAIVDVNINYIEENVYDLQNREYFKQIMTLIKVGLKINGKQITNFDELSYEKKYQCIELSCEMVDLASNHKFNVFKGSFSIPTKHDIPGISYNTTQLCIKNITPDIISDRKIIYL